MSELYRIVPWYNTEEWQNVYDTISDPSSNKENAINILLIWKARSPSLPSGIESTLGLLQVSNEDKRQSNDVYFNDQLLRMAYSSAVMRFVNHMLDTEIEKGTSLYQAAKILGVPDWIIDLRHETAHSNTLPPLTLLREACENGLQWLKKNYWDKHKYSIRDCICEEKALTVTAGNKISTFINFCFSLSVSAHSKVKIKNLSEIPDISLKGSIVNDAKELLGDNIDLSDLSTVSLKSLINIMNTHSHKFLKVDDAKSLVKEALLGEDSVFLSRDLLYFFSASDFKYKKRLYSSYVQCFEVLLKFLHTNDLLLDLVMGLIKVTQNENSGHFKALLAALWVSEILEALKKCKIFLKEVKKITSTAEKPKKRKELKQSYKQLFANNTGNLVLDLQKPVPAELQDINVIQPIITAYNSYLTYFIRNLLDLLEPQLPTTVVEKVYTLAKLISSPEKFPVATSSIIYTADDLKMTIDEVIIVDQCDEDDDDSVIVSAQESQQQMPSGVWRLATRNYDWSKCPIGVVPWHYKVNSTDNNENNNLN